MLLLSELAFRSHHSTGRFAGGDANANSDFRPASPFPICVHTLYRGQHVQPTGDCRASFCPIAPRDGRAENNHQPIADKLVDMATVASDYGLHPAEIIIEPDDHLIRRSGFRKCSKTANVCEDDAYDASFAAHYLVPPLPKLIGDLF